MAAIADWTTYLLENDSTCGNRGDVWTVEVSKVLVENDYLTPGDLTRVGVASVAVLPLSEVRIVMITYEKSTLKAFKFMRKYIGNIQ